MHFSTSALGLIAGAVLLLALGCQGDPKPAESDVPVAAVPTAALAASERVALDRTAPAAAAVYYRARCAEGHGNSCRRLGVLQFEGRGVEKDVVAALETFQT